MNTPKKQRLSIAMLASTVLRNEEFINTEETSYRQTIELPKIEEATLYIKKTAANTPIYSEWFNSQVPPELFDQSISPGAALVLRTSDATFVISFGQGRHLVAKEHLVLDFGLKVVLNSVDAKQIRSLDKASNGEKPLNSKNQGVIASNIMELLFDPEQDVATSITGTSKDSFFNGSLISGRDNICINTDTSLENIHLLLAEVYTQFKSKAYKKEFAFIDDIKRIRDHEQISKLNDELTFKLDNNINLENC